MRARLDKNVRNSLNLEVECIIWRAFAYGIVLVFSNGPKRIWQGELRRAYFAGRFLSSSFFEKFSLIRF